ncbi:MAG: DUF58 domain-containing protein [Firmicutes bacterium]|nr:DUF58 domain-containing protein [Bacillota bacterium]
MKKQRVATQPRLIKRRSWLAGWLSIGFLLFGLAFGLAEYFIAAAVFVLLLIIAAIQVRLQHPLFELNENAGKIVRGQTGQVTLRVSNPGYWPFFPVRFKLSIKKEEQEPIQLADYEIILKPQEVRDLEIELICPHRGEYLVYLQQYYAEDIFGFFAYPCCLSPEKKLISLPRLDLSTVAEAQSDLIEQEENIRGQHGQRGQLTAESRTYQRGDSMRIIHWKKSASRRELFTRLREPLAEYSCCLLLDNRPYASGEKAYDYEDRLCETACSFLFMQLSIDHPITLLPGNLNLQSPQDMDKAAELLAMVPFNNETIFNELTNLLGCIQLPMELFIATAQEPTPYLHLTEQIINRGCPVVLITPFCDIKTVEQGLSLPLPIIAIELPQTISPWLEV